MPASEVDARGISDRSAPIGTTSAGAMSVRKLRGASECHKRERSGRITAGQQTSWATSYRMVKQSASSRSSTSSRGSASGWKQIVRWMGIHRGVTATNSSPRQGFALPADAALDPARRCPKISMIRAKRSYASPKPEALSWVSGVTFRPAKRALEGL